MPLMKPLRAASFHSHRSVSPFELFIDLVYVAAILHLGNLLAKDFTAPAGSNAQYGLSSFTFFVGLWLSWNSFNFFMVRYYSDDAATKFHFVVVGILLLGMAAFTGGDFGDANRDHYAYFFLGLRGYFILLQILVATFDSQQRKLTIMYAIIYLTSSVFLVSSSGVVVDGAFVMWWVAFAVEAVGCGIIEAKFAPEFSYEVAAHRHGELTMIAIGENIIQLVVRPVLFDEDNVYAMVCGFLMAFFLVLLYFECQPHDVSKHAFARGGIAAWIFTYAHCFLLYFLMCVGVGVKLYMKNVVYNIDNGKNYTKSKYSWFLCTMLIASVVFNNLVRLSHKAFRSGEDKTTSVDKTHEALGKGVKRFFWVLRFVATGCIFLIAGMAKQLTPVTSLLSMLMMLVFQVILDVVQKILYPDCHDDHDDPHSGHGYNPVRTSDDVQQP